MHLAVLPCGIPYYSSSLDLEKVRIPTFKNKNENEACVVIGCSPGKKS